MRGHIASIFWAAEAQSVPWVVFVNRVSASERCYGEREPMEQEAAHTSAAHLRRGEFISSISGSRSRACSSAGRPPLASCLRITTSEQQEIAVGDACLSMDFCFEAEIGYEIVGLTLEDGMISGVKLAILAPSRVPNTAGVSVDLVAMAAGAGAFRTQDAADLPVKMESKKKVADRQKSLQALKLGRARRFKEAEEAIGSTAEKVLEEAHQSVQQVLGPSGVEALDNVQKSSAELAEQASEQINVLGNNIWEWGEGLRTSAQRGLEEQAQDLPSDIGETFEQMRRNTQEIGDGFGAKAEAVSASWWQTIDIFQAKAAEASSNFQASVDSLVAPPAPTCQSSTKELTAKSGPIAQKQQPYRPPKARGSTGGVVSAMMRGDLVFD